MWGSPRNSEPKGNTSPNTAQRNKQDRATLLLIDRTVVNLRAMCLIHGPCCALQRVSLLSKYQSREVC